MTGRRLRGTDLTAAARGLNAGFHIAVAAYCFLAYVPFAYVQFIQPNVFVPLADFVTLSPALFWLGLLVTALTLLPRFRRGPGRHQARAYVLGWGLVGVWLFVDPPLVSMANTPRSLITGLLALLPPVTLALADHAALPAVPMQPSNRLRILAACILSAGAVWLVHAAAVPFRLAQATGIDLPPRSLAIGLAVALVFDLFAATILFLVLLLATCAARLTRAPATVEYWLFVGIFGGFATLVLYFLVAASLSFAGGHAWLASAGLGLAIAAFWTDMARIRSQPPASSGSIAPAGPDSLDVFAAAVSGRSRVTAAAVLVLMPFAAYALANVVARLDWNFLMQKIVVLGAWLAAFSAVFTVLERLPFRRQARRLWIPIPIVVLAAYVGVGRVEAGTTLLLDSYAAIDPSFRLVRDARTARSSEAAELYEYLRRNTLVAPNRVQPPAVDLAESRAPTPLRRPHIFLFVVDSLRRDYLSPYNPAVTFTPEIARLAADSFVFERAFTRYAGTALAVPAIWAGGMVPHTVRPIAFGPRNTLLKLLVANDYLRIMEMDNIVTDLMPPAQYGENLAVLGRHRKPGDFDACKMQAEAQTEVAARGNRPVFLYALPQNVHIAVAERQTLLPGETYPGFYPQVASSVRRLDGCLGEFIAFLKRSNLYDDSVIIITSDHGDSLGEAGRWGHAYFVFPEVMRVPLIVHLPPWLRARVTAEVADVSFPTDIPQTLYQLLGYAPRDLGPLFGQPLFAPVEVSRPRRRDGFLLASSYGAVYAMLHDNGTNLYVVDAVDGRDYAFDLSRTLLGEPTALTAGLTTANRRLIREQVDALAAFYRISGMR